MVDPYKNIYSTTRKEIDLRKEFDDILSGSTFEIEKGRIGLLRKMRRDSDGNLISCSCRDKITNEPDRDYFCKFCRGHGYYWDEHIITYFANDMTYGREGGQNKEYDKLYFYLKYNTNITDDDYLIILKADADGNIVVPHQRERFFKVFSADSFRSDFGRIEYWRIRANEERHWSVWYEQNR